MKAFINGFMEFFKDGEMNSMSRLILFGAYIPASAALILHAIKYPLTDLLLVAFLAPAAGAYGYAKGVEVKQAIKEKEIEQGAAPDDKRSSS